MPIEAYLCAAASPIPELVDWSDQPGTISGGFGRCTAKTVMRSEDSRSSSDEGNVLGVED